MRQYQRVVLAVSPRVEVGRVGEERDDGLLAGLCLPRVEEVYLVPARCAFDSNALKQLTRRSAAIQQHWHQEQEKEKEHLQYNIKQQRQPQQQQEQQSQHEQQQQTQHEQKQEQEQCQLQ